MEKRLFVVFVLLINVVLSFGQSEKFSKSVDSLKNIIMENRSDTLRVNARNELAKLLYTNGDFTYINYLNDNIKDFSVSKKYTKVKADTYYILFKIFMNKDKKKSLSYADTVRKYMPSHITNFDFLVARARMLFDSGKRTEGIESLLSVIKLAKKENQGYHLAIARGELASLYVMSSRVDEALFQIDSARIYFNKVDDYQNLGKLNSLKAGGFANIGKYYKSNSEYINNIAYLESKGASVGDIINSYFNVAVNYDSLKEFDKAVQYFKKVIALAEESSNTIYLALGKCGLGITYRESNKYKESEILLNESLELSKKIGYSYLTLESDLALGELYIKMKKFDLAKKLLDRSLPIIKQSDDSINLLETYIAYSKYYYGVKNYKESISYANKAIKLREIVKDNGGILDAYEYLFLSNEAIKNYKAALLASKIYSQYKDSVFVTDKNNAMARIEIQFETEKKEQQIELLEVTTQNQQLSIEKAEQERNMMFAGLGLLVLLTVPVGFYARQRSKNKVLEARINSENKECTRIAKELHDSVSGSLTSIRYLLESGTEGNRLVENIESVSKEVRGISHKLNMSALANQGIKEAVYDALMLNQFPKDIQLAINMPEGFEVKDFEVKINYIRILQELVQNTIKYAEASSVEISFEQEKQSTLLTYQDNGKGCDMAQISLGNGLRNIKDRVKYIKGTVQFDSQPENGFYCKIEA